MEGGREGRRKTKQHNTIENEMRDGAVEISWKNEREDLKRIHGWNKMKSRKDEHTQDT